MSIQGALLNFSISYSTDCHLQLAGEPELNPAIMGALDGNNSLKRFIRQGRQSDPLEFKSDYFLSQEYVNQFKDEVKRKVRQTGAPEVRVSLGYLIAINI
jgi:Kyakuja-Dileera-Zisupton transposase